MKAEKEKQQFITKSESESYTTTTCRPVDTGGALGAKAPPPQNFPQIKFID